MDERIASALMVHGGGGGGWEWNVWKAVFEAGHLRVAAPDLQASPEGLAATGFDDYAAQVRAALDALPRPRALVGASLGGLLAMACADGADALVLVNPLPPSPWHAQLPGRDWPDVVPWQRDARLTGTQRALPDADEATALFAFRHWRDESGRAMREACGGIEVEPPACRVLCIASMVDDDVPPRLTAALASAWEASLLRATAVSHVGPLLGRNAAECAAQALAWLSAR
ncbi:alpha/beta fold hydrolase [Luteimonas viscosa]|uniref:Alpha/beta fold hydrolase n=1 Tax=Luteimonas viscosa TaxID=1132694 RepID=A0A5D4XT59_9GAMM|nr:alpha/beta hydrolase [Luteimonas viscosa]TYT27175.1 alpha/beta fold hydrolase [Luteimonas viscosa]